jgi:hypothetical protein
MPGLMKTLCVRAKCSLHEPYHTCCQYSAFPTKSVWFGSSSCLEFYSPGYSEASAGFKIFYSKSLCFFAEKKTYVFTLAALDYIYYIQENCHIYAIVS